VKNEIPGAAALLVCRAPNVLQFHNTFKRLHT